MEEDLWAAILAEEDDNAIEYIMIENLLVNRDEVQNVRQFNLDNFTEEEIRQNFRFNRADIELLANGFGLPERIITGTGNNVNRICAMCMVLRRLAYPNRLSDISSMFGLSPQSMSQIINTTISLVLEHRGHLIENLNNLGWLDQNKMRYYSQAISNKGAAINRCWAFLDGTKREISRPIINQQEYYSGHSRTHCLKYQSLLTPDGMVVSLKGAWPGRRHDAGMFRESTLYAELEQKAVFGDEQFVIYADQGYGLMELLITPFAGQPADLQPDQLLFNNAMKILRVAVEWGFQKIITLFAFLDFKKNQKLLLQDLESMYKVGMLLTNCHTCLYGSQVGDYFLTEPPTLNEYLGL